MSEGQMILVAGGLLCAGLVASLVAGRLRVPSLVLFLGIGMAVGSDGTGWLDFGDYELSKRVGVLALALILFEGGLAAGWDEVRPVLGPAIALALIGTLVTAVVSGLVAAWLFDLPAKDGLLLGSIVASTDGAAIFGLLRGSSLRRRVARTLEGEAGFNDPVAVLLVLGFIDAIVEPHYGVGDFALLLARQLGIGAAVGLAGGWLATQLVTRLRLDSPGLYPVASLATAGVAFGAADVLHGSGFLAVYLVGLALGSAPIPAKRTIVSFHQGLAWVAQLAMFLVLGLLVFPSHFGSVAVRGTALALVVVLVARPLATFAATALQGFGVGERIVLGWAGLRGAVPVVLATFPVLAGVPGSRDFFDIVFFAVVVSTLLQGSTFEWVAKRLGATTSEPALPSPIAETGTIRRLGAEVIEFGLAPGDAAVGMRVRDLALPRDALVNVIVRRDEAIPPRGSTRLEAGDRLHVLVRQEAARGMEALLRRWRTGPLGAPPRPSPLIRGSAPVFTVRPWRTERDGDAGAPEAIDGRQVVEVARVRRDVRGALCVLEDGSFAVTGPLVARGGRALLSDWVRRRLRALPDGAERAWFEEVLGALAL